MRLLTKGFIRAWIVISTALKVWKGIILMSSVKAMVRKLYSYARKYMYTEMIGMKPVMIN
jgi:hypothetical protein